MNTTISGNNQQIFKGKILIKGKILVETGLHIGGGGETLNIGGLDKSIIRDPVTRQPYLPGSSIKGKLRSILEAFLQRPINRQSGKEVYRYESDDLVDGLTDRNFIPFEGAKTCPLSRIFGSTGTKCWVKRDLADRENLLDKDSQGNITNEIEKIGDEQYAKINGRNLPARLIVRDTYLDASSIQILEKIDTGLYMTEWKFENGLDRITAAANPRQLERIPRGAKFNFEMVYTIEDQSSNIVEEDLKHLAIALAILEDDALGGHGSRGYGKVRFENFQFFYRGLEQYRNVGTSTSNLLEPFYSCSSDPDDPNQASATTALLGNFGALSDQMKAKLLPALGGSDNDG
ncbi:MAG: type III-A CRISPR-associated RAMP protein Csm3 [Cyanothece sp. SIO2G6]|nr:type III-A CRISPR-associated RAMP protein Csm3 [Cyanothece sp. SIO2G6]